MVKALFIEARRRNLDSPISIAEITSQLPKNAPAIIIAYSIQYKPLAFELKKEFEKKGGKVKEIVQVLGCTQLKSQFPIILIGSGKFHALNLALQNKDVYIYSVDNGKLVNISKEHAEELEELRLKKKNNINKFLNASRIGIIISTKPGQNKSKLAEELKKKIEKKYAEKRVYLFISNNINLSELENFSADLWINTACQGLINDSNRIINYDDIIDFLGKN